MKSWKNIYWLGLLALVAFICITIKKHDSDLKFASEGMHGNSQTNPAASHEASLPSDSKTDSDMKNSPTALNPHPDSSNTFPNTANSGTTPSGASALAAKKENDCFRFSYQHQEKNQNRDIEEFLNDTNAFPIVAVKVNPKSICVKVNNKPVNYKFVKKGEKSEVVIGSVVGPDSTIQVSYCTGKAPCRESCEVKSKNKVDELLSDSEVGGVENAELETQVKELRNVASAHESLMDSTIIRDWNQLQSKEWVCEK